MNKTQKKHKLYLLIFITFILLSCKSSQKIQHISKIFIPQDSMILNKISNDELKPVLDSMQILDSFITNINKNKITYHSFNSKIKIEVLENNTSNTYIANLSIIKDSIIYITLKAQILGISAIGLQVCLKRDSLILINRVDKTIQKYSIDYLQNLTNVPLKFSHFQDILMGSQSNLEPKYSTFKMEKEKLLISNISSNLKMLFNINKENWLITECKIDDNNPQKNRTLQIKLSEFKPTFNFLFSAYREIILSETNNLYIYLTFKEFSFNEPIKYSFSLPNFATNKIKK